jgi:hypothetical protein
VQIVLGQITISVKAVLRVISSKNQLAISFVQMDFIEIYNYLFVVFVHQIARLVLIIVVVVHASNKCIYPTETALHTVPWELSEIQIILFVYLVLPIVKIVLQRILAPLVAPILLYKMVLANQIKVFI